jgi:hypothetical protein
MKIISTRGRKPVMSKLDAFIAQQTQPQPKPGTSKAVAIGFLDELGQVVDYYRTTGETLDKKAVVEFAQMLAGEFYMKNYNLNWERSICPNTFMEHDQLAVVVYLHAHGSLPTVFRRYKFS